jgi:hypothetical protein
MPAAIDAKLAASNESAVRNSFTCVKEMPHSAQPAAAAVSAMRSLFIVKPVMQLRTVTGLMQRTGIMFVAPTTTAGARMECSLAALIACFSWSNLYIDSDMIVLDHGVQTSSYRETEYIWRSKQFPIVNSWETTNRRADNPYGRLSIGYQLDLRNLVLAFQAEHTSSLSSTDDRGVNGIAIKAKWFPFRR